MGRAWGAWGRLGALGGARPHFTPLHPPLCPPPPPPLTHPPLPAISELRKNHGKEEARARDLFYGLWIPDLFMKRVEVRACVCVWGVERARARACESVCVCVREGAHSPPPRPPHPLTPPPSPPTPHAQANGDWSLFCPNEAPGLADCWGDEFEALYERYEREGRARKKVKAQQLWFAVLEAQASEGVGGACVVVGGVGGGGGARACVFDGRTLSPRACMPDPPRPPPTHPPHHTHARAG